MRQLLPAQRAGFTLIELLVVVVIIGILAAIGVKGYAAAQDKARNSSMLSNTRTVTLGIESWKADHAGLPTELVGTDPSQWVAANSPSVVTNWPSQYVPGCYLPKTPWASLPQTAMDATYNVSASSLITIKGALDPTTDSSGNESYGQLSVDQYGVFADGGDGGGPGRPPAIGVGPSNRLDYGYMYYVCSLNSGRYAVFGVGKGQNANVGKAEVVAVKANFQ